MRRAWLLPIGLALCVASAPVVAEAEPFAVVANAENDARDVDAATLRRLFLKSQVEWPGGLSAKPFGRPANSPAHRALLEHVLQMDQARLTRHWISLKQRTGQRSTLEVESEDQLVLLLRRFPGALGVLPVARAEAEPQLAIVLRLP